MAKERKYLVARITPGGSKTPHKGITGPLAGHIQRYFEKNGAADLAVIDESDDGREIHVYADRAVNKVLALANSYASAQETGSRQKIPVKVERIENHQQDTPGDSERVKTALELAGLKAKVADLEAALTSAKEYHKTDIDDLRAKYFKRRAEARGYEAELKELRDKVLEEGGGLEAIATNKRRYHEAQERVIDSHFREVSASIEKRVMQEPVEGVDEALKALENRDFYKSKEGQELFKRLPGEARNAAEMAWKEAERIKEAHEKFLRESKISLLVRVSVGSDRKISVYIPVLAKSDGELALRVKDTVEMFRDNLRKMEGKGSTVDLDSPYQNFTTAGVITSSHLNRFMTESINQALADYNITINPLRMNAYVERKENGHIIDLEPPKDPENFGDWLIVEMKKKGHDTEGAMAKATGLPLSTIQRIIKNDGKPYSQTKEKIAAALGLKVEQLNTAIASFN